MTRAKIGPAKAIRLAASTKSLERAADSTQAEGAYD